MKKEMGLGHKPSWPLKKKPNKVKYNFSHSFDPRLSS